MGCRFVRFKGIFFFNVLERGTLGGGADVILGGNLFYKIEK